MKKILTLLLSVFLIACLSACGAEEKAQETETETETKTETEASSQGKTLVIYFSATGNTRGVAKKIADITGADIYEIKAKEEYTDEDLDYDDPDSRTSKEQNDKGARPEIGSDPVSLDGYTTVYIGYPIWWGEEPRIMDTFVESCDFDGMTVIPFCTSGASGIGESGKNLADNAGSGNWLDGERFAGSATEEELKEWLK